MSAALSFEPDEPQGSGLPGDGWDEEGAPHHYAHPVRNLRRHRDR